MLVPDQVAATSLSNMSQCTKRLKFVCNVLVHGSEQRVIASPRV